jgi:hypothetical protein
VAGVLGISLAKRNASIAVESATNAWEERDIFEGMKNGNANRIGPGLFGAYTARGRRGSSPCAPGAWQAAAASLLLVAMAVPAAANPRIGPTSSASVEISVSVAPSFKLASREPLLGDSKKPANYCIATNGEPMALPVLLIQMDDGSGRDQAANPLSWCEAGKDLSQNQAHAHDRERNGPLFIRPE